MVDGDLATLLSFIFVMFLPAYGYLLAIHGSVSGLRERLNGVELRVKCLEAKKYVYDD